uniref:Not3 domain-containing protein n=1 Tax=Panagrellus redivivus TaxID=6233 RepID=A0A7E4ZXB4_PANRE
MAEKRKLLLEVEKTYKKVDEGIEIFEETITKMYEANSENQRDKFQDDLKREIKKLQRLRDLIKGWQFASDIKDKDKLSQYRRLIETKMEQFKDIERENKTKPHSKQGLSAEEKLDPREKEKSDAIDWLRSKIRSIQDDVDRTEMRIESAQSAGGNKRRKGKDDSNKEKLEELRKHNERLNYHVTNLEVCMRLVTNDQKDPKEVMEVLQDVLEPYVEALDPDSDLNAKDLDPYGVYEELEIGDFIPQLAGVTHASIDDEKEESAPRSANTSPTRLSSPPPVVPVPATTTVVVGGVVLPGANAEAVERVRNPSVEKPASVTSTKSSRDTGNSEERTSLASPPLNSTPPPAMPYNAIAAGLKTPLTTVLPTSKTLASGPESPKVESVHTGAENSAPSTPSTAIRQAPLIQQVQPKPILPNIPPIEAQQQQQQPLPIRLQQQQPPTPTRFTNTVELNQNAVFQNAAPAPVQQSRSIDGTTTTHSSVSSAPGLPQPSFSMDGNPPMSADDILLREITALNADSSGETQTAEIPAWLGLSPLGRVQLSAEQEKHIKRLEDAVRTVPHRFDSEPQRPQMPRIPFQSYPSYPQTQQASFQTQDYYGRLNAETLLFIFYYMEGSKAQLLAAQALKKLSWRFHTKYLMWFQRHEEPKVITDDFEQGSYVYFDFERWAQRKKDLFVFEYRYLEDRDLSALL